MRRSAAQLQALAQVEKQIRSTDPHIRRKYLRSFTEAFRKYSEVLSPEDLAAELVSADVLLLGDYHALPRSQEFAAELVEQLSSVGREVVLGLELLYARDQRVLNEWGAGTISDDELRQRVRYDREWGYAWEPVIDLLRRARDFNAKIYGLDCMPRGDLRRIGIRDRHAARKISELRAEHPHAIIVVLFGESHLAPEHLPKLLRKELSGEKILTVLQNVDALYWQASGEPGEPVRAVRVGGDAICVFNATPLEKYESYRLCIERWRQERPGAEPDIAPTFFNLAQALLRFLHLEDYTNSSCGPRFLLDLLPEVIACTNEVSMRAMLARFGVPGEKSQDLLEDLSVRGCRYLESANVLLVRHFKLPVGVEEAARFVCASGWSEAGHPAPELPPEDRFYRKCLQKALCEYGAKVLLPGRESFGEKQLYAFQEQGFEDLPELSRSQSIRLIDFVLLHRDFECNARHYRSVPALVEEGRQYAGKKFELATEWLGGLLGSDLYDAYVQGRIGRRSIRAYFLGRYIRPGEAKAAYFRLSQRCRGQKRLLVA
jgi:hypothetical protein